MSFAGSRSRRSTVSTTAPGITLVVFGETIMRPTVATVRPGTALTASLIATVNFAAASIASCRWSMGVVPAWFAKPVTVTSDQRSPTMPSTTPIWSPAFSSSPPCSMCSSM